MVVLSQRRASTFCKDKEGECEVRTCDCFSCGTRLKDIGEEGKYLQPIDGLEFTTSGHYGSTYFDPCDGTKLAIVICDTCLREYFGDAET
jgi:hypothetical protein